MAEWKPGDYVAGYRIDGLIARGATANVYLASTPGGRVVALKVSVLTGALANASYAVTTLEHPGVVAVLDAGASHDVPYMAMERIEAPALSTILDDHGRLNPVEAVSIVSQVADAMAAGHKTGVIHGALTPRKVLVGAERVWVEGYGTQLSPEAILAGRVVLPDAAFDHLAPEQIAGVHADERSDVYALGSVLYTTLSGSAPFPGASIPIGGEAPPQLPSLPEALDKLIRRALAPDPEDRFPSAAEFSAELKAQIELPRRMYAKLDGPEVVVAQAEFEVEVGVAATPSSRVAGTPLVLPDSVEGAYQLTVQVIADGFSLRQGESWRQDLTVDAKHLYPTFPLHLTAEAQDHDIVARSLQATYTVDGQTLGLAVLSLAVVVDPALAPARPRPVRAGDFPTQTAGEAADLTVNITWGKEEDTGRLMWTLESPHPIDLPSEALPVRIGRDPEDFARALVDKIPTYKSPKTLYRYLIGKGSEIAEQLPPRFWAALSDAAAYRGDGPPTVLFISAEAHVPWELAVLPVPLDPDEAPFLSVQAAVGRWIHAEGDKPPPDPPRVATGAAMAVISGVYTGSSLERLVAAEEEAKELQRLYHAQPVEATEEALIDCLEGTPDADLLHFAIHGKWDSSGFENGLIMVDGTAIDPAVIRGDAELPRPAFVFLNACQVASGDTILGDYAGTAAAFLKRGAPAVVAPLWSIDDELAKKVALRFYERVFEGERPAEVLRGERESFRKTTPPQVSATSLAFQFFGHPAMRVERTPLPKERTDG